MKISCRFSSLMEIAVLLYICSLQAWIVFPNPVSTVNARGDAMTTLLTSSVDDESTSVNEDTIHTTGTAATVARPWQPTAGEGITAVVGDVTSGITPKDDVITAFSTTPPSERNDNANLSTPAYSIAASVTSSLTSTETTSSSSDNQTVVDTEFNVTGAITTRSTTDATSPSTATPGERTREIVSSTTTTSSSTSDVTTSISTTLSTPAPSTESGGVVAAISVLFVLLVLAIGVGVYLYVRYYCPRRRPPQRSVAMRSTKEKQVQLAALPSVRSKPVKSVDFHSYVKDLERDSGLLFAAEYEELKFVGRDQSWEHAEMQCNRAKNRFTNILPYDRTRVKLLPLEDVDGSDYINANWIPGYSSKREFIATQGPLPSTKDDFWRLVWEYNCRTVVMLTLCAENGRIKCDQYWPSDAEPLFYGDLQVKVMNENITSDWHVREMHISLGEQTRHIKHFHYMKWPDMRVPDKLSMLDFVRLVRGYVDDSRASPIIVHCSAGVGRTGTFIALDVLSQQLDREDIVDVFAVVYQMRMSRVLMVQTEQQYVFIHECVKHILDERDRINRRFTVKQNGQVVYVNCLDLDSPDESSTEEIDESLSDEGIEDESCDGK